MAETIFNAIWNRSKGRITGLPYHSKLLQSENIIYFIGVDNAKINRERFEISLLVNTTVSNVIFCTFTLFQISQIRISEIKNT